MHPAQRATDSFACVSLRQHRIYDSDRSNIACTDALRSHSAVSKHSSIANGVNTFRIFAQNAGNRVKPNDAQTHGAPRLIILPSAITASPGFISAVQLPRYRSSMIVTVSD